jgi:hypothetical protein
MASRELLVLIVLDSALRSALIARLSLAGESIVTLDGDLNEPVLDRIAPAPKILIVDSESLGDLLRPLLDSEKWARIIVLADRVEGFLTDRVCRIDRREALTAVEHELKRWRLSL